VTAIALRIGTSGWQYRDWRGAVYPRDAPTREWLQLYADQFDTVEINNSFYRLPDRARFAEWAKTVPESFCFAVKASRYLTHVKRLQTPVEPVARLLGAARGLGPKLGPVLLQLPPTLRVNCDALESTLQNFPSTRQVAVEFRHASWDSAEVDAVLAGRNATRVLADRRGRVEGWRTANWVYARLHEGRAAPVPCYGERALRSWVDRIIDAWGPNASGYVYFNNDAHGCAAHNAARFRVLAARAGLDT
jgi:uncharacterized protein YecE (DUF72 family)